MRSVSDAKRIRLASLRRKRSRQPRARVRRMGKAVWAVIAAVLVTAVTDSLTGVVTAGIRSGWEHVTSGEPLEVHSRIAPPQCGDPWVVPDGKRGSQHFPSQLFEDDDRTVDWLRARHAIERDHTTVELTIRGRSGTAVVLTAMRVRIVRRNAPLQGTEFSFPCGGTVPVRVYQANLDENAPVARAANGSTKAKPFPYQVTQSDPEVFRVTAVTAKCDCQWRLELAYVDGEKAHVKVVDDHGQPFRTTADPNPRPPVGG